MQLWVMSDWHWKHKNIYTFTNASGVRIRERFADATEGDAYMEQRCHDLIKGPDHVWYLGDWTMFRGKHLAEEFIKFRKSLPGHWRIIPGNHDHYAMEIYIRAGFEKIRGSNMLDGLLMTHYPVHESSIGPRVLGNVHGHTHGNPDISPRHLNVCVERTNYEPIPIEEVKTRLKAKALPPTTDVNGVEVTGP